MTVPEIMPADFPIEPNVCLAAHSGLRFELRLVRFVPRTDIELLFDLATEIRLTTSRLILSLLVEEGREDAATVKEIRHHASKIAFAYNKGARQYLRDAKDG